MTTAMKILCLLLLVGAADSTGKFLTYGKGSGGGGGGGGGGIGSDIIDQLRVLIEELEGDLYDINKDLSIIKTFAAAADDRFNTIDDRLIPNIRITNEQQYDLIAKAEDQVLDWKNRVDVAVAEATGNTRFAKETGEEIGNQEKYIAEYAIVNNRKEAKQIFFLRKTAKDFEGDVLQSLYEKINLMTKLNDDAYGRITALETFVDSRIAEYGIASVYPGETFIPFTVDFPAAPDVNVFFTGFTARLDKDGGYGGGYGDSGFTRLALDKHPSGVTKEGFTIEAKDLSNGSAAADMFFCTYTASYNLDKDFKFDDDDRNKSGGFRGGGGYGRNDDNGRNGYGPPTSYDH